MVGVLDHCLEHHRRGHELVLLRVFIQQLLQLGDFQLVRRTFFLYKIIKEL